MSYQEVAAEDESNRQSPQLYSFEIVNRFEHDPNAFTQGLQFERNCDQADPSQCQDMFLESTGIYGASTVRRVDVATGDVLTKTSLHNRYFGEGLTRFGDHIYQLTWRSPIVLIYNNDLQQVDIKETPLRDGWGLTTDGEHLIMTDSGSTLYFLNPETFEIAKELTVKFNGQEVTALNELEYIHGRIWANIWFSDCIVMIHPSTGRVVGWLNLSDLTKEAKEIAANREIPIDVLNGIAHDAAGDRVFVTGKLWPLLYEIKLTESIKLNRTSKEAVQGLCLKK